MTNPVASRARLSMRFMSVPTTSIAAMAPSPRGLTARPLSMAE